MLFTSSIFFILVFITLSLYYLVQQQHHQVLLLVLASFIFYAWHYPLLLLLLLGSVIINILTSYWVLTNEDSTRKRLFATLGVIANLSILAFFKYSPLIGRTFFENNTSIGDFLVSIPLPIGISFFTFQGISLVVDTFRGKELTKGHHQFKSLREYVSNASLFIAFFPQLVAGPIVKAHEFLPQIKYKVWREVNKESCFKNLITGYFLKMVIADNLKDQTFWMEYPYFEASSGLRLIMMLFGYSMQIFADFAGYSLIAIGIAGLFGYWLKDNFMFPYISTTFSEFWRRWHISLSSFLKEYLYIPLGGNRKGKGRTYFNLMMTMILGGLWHGAAWSYAVWGTYHGLALAVERLFNDIFKVKIKHRIGLIIKGFWVFSLVTLGWLLFKLPEFSHVISYIETFFSASFMPTKVEVFKILYILIFSLPVILYHGLYLYRKKLPNISFSKLEPIVYASMLFLIVTNRGTSGAFIYFQF